MPEELWMEIHDIVQEAVIKIIPKKKKCKKARRLSEEALQIAEKRREAKGKGKKERYTYLNAEFQRIASRDKKGFLGTSLVVRWLRLCTTAAGSKGSSPGLGTRIPHAAQCSRKR